MQAKFCRKQGINPWSVGERPINWNQRRSNKRAVIEEMINILDTSGSAWARKIFGNMKALVVGSTEAVVRSNSNKLRAKTTIVKKFFIEGFNF